MTAKLLAGGVAAVAAIGAAAAGMTSVALASTGQAGVLQVWPTTWGPYAQTEGDESESGADGSSKGTGPENDGVRDPFFDRPHFEDDSEDYADKGFGGDGG